MKFIFILASFLIVGAIADDIILTPPDIQYKVANPTNVGIVFIVGAQIAPEQYTALVDRLHEQLAFAEAPMKAWVGIPQLPLNIANPLDLKSNVQRIIGMMKKAGLPENSKMVYAAHSLGGAMIVNLIGGQKDVSQQPDAVVLLGSFVSRKFFGDSKFPVPSLTIGGSLDGLCRVTRIMESHVMQANQPDQVALTIPGMSHFSICTGKAPYLVEERDLRPEITQEAAFSQVSDSISSFLSVTFKLNDPVASEYLAKAEKQSAEFFHPLVEVYKLEGYYGFQAPCNDAPLTDECQHGSSWTNIAQQYMAGSIEQGPINNATVQNVDRFRVVWEFIPKVHLPKIHNRCTDQDASCQLSTETVTQNVYDNLDKLDTGFASTSAVEARAELNSRQAVMDSAGFRNVNFTETDVIADVCAEINAYSFEWALNKADNGTRARYEAHGQKVVFAESDVASKGYSWIWTPIKYANVTLPSGEVAIQVTSTTMRTSIDYFIPAARGFHYCKLMTPARALELIYVDALRYYYSLKSSFQSNEVVEMVA